MSLVHETIRTGPRSPHQKLWTNIPPGPLNDDHSQVWRL